MRRGGVLPPVFADVLIFKNIVGQGLAPAVKMIWR